MLSFGIDAARAFSIAFWSARFAAGSGPPSFAATISARVSFVKSWPRLASAAPFLCLIDDHLLCPDILLSHQLEAPQHRRVLAKVPLEGEDADPKGLLHGLEFSDGPQPNRSARSGRQPCAAHPAALP